MAEVLVNNYQGTLSASITSGATTLTLSAPIKDYTGANATGTVRLLIESEILLATVSAGTVTGVLRGQEGTTAASHDAGVVVDVVATGGAVTQYVTDRLSSISSVSISSGPFSSLPASGSAVGQTYYFTDTFSGLEKAVWTGSAWDYYAHNFGRLPQPLPNLADWTTFNTSVSPTRSVDSSRGGIWMDYVSNGSVNLVGLLRARPAYPYSLTMMARYFGPLMGGGYVAGLGFRRDSDGKVKTACWGTNNNERNMSLAINIDWNSYTSFGGVIGSAGNAGETGGLIKLRVRNEGDVSLGFGGARAYRFGAWHTPDDSLWLRRSEGWGDFGESQNDVVFLNGDGGEVNGVRVYLHILQLYYS